MCQNSFFLRRMLKFYACVLFTVFKMLCRKVKEKLFIDLPKEIKVLSFISDLSLIVCILTVETEEYLVKERLILFVSSYEKSYLHANIIFRGL